MLLKVSMELSFSPIVDQGQSLIYQSRLSKNGVNSFWICCDPMIQTLWSQHLNECYALSLGTVYCGVQRGSYF